MILKAGTYKFNKTPTELVSGTYLINSTINGSFGILFSWECEAFVSTGTSWGVKVDGNYTEIYYSGGWLLDEAPTNTIPTDTEVDDTFGTWYISNTNYNEVNAKPLAEITYNGETIAQLNAGETATLSCEGKKMASDVVVKVNEVESKIPEGYVKPEGSLPITENGTYPVADKEEVVVNVPIPDGYIKPEGSLPITENGTYPVTDKEEVVVDVPTTTDGVPVEMLNQAVMNELIAPNSTKGEVGAVYLYHGEASDTYEYDALYILEEVSE